MGKDIEWLREQYPPLKDSIPGLRHHATGELCGPCPKCGGTDRLIVNTKQDRFWCRVCGEKGDRLDHAAWQEGTDIAGLFKKHGPAEEKCGVLDFNPNFNDPSAVSENPKINSDDFPTDDKIAEFTERNDARTKREPGPEHLDYIRKRGFEVALPYLKKNGLIGFESADKDGPSRLVFALKTPDGKIVGLQLIYIDGPPKRNVKGSKIKYGSFFLPGPNNNSPTVICESIIDAISAVLAYDCNAIAVLSSTVVNKIQSMDIAIPILFFDGDEAGRKATDQAAAILPYAKAVDWNQAPKGAKDINDLWRGGHQETIVRMIETAQPVSSSGVETFSLNQFALNGAAHAMEEQMLEDKFVLGSMAIYGQSTVFYGGPNVGKTLLTLWMLIKKIKAKEIIGGDVYYINADDNYKGLVFKLKLAEKYGFMMLAPGHKDFKPELLPKYLMTLIKNNSAKGIILILDTVKKFTDLMKKDKASEFGECVRQFISHGGTVLMLAHINKHRDENKKVVYSGTTDLIDDADCAYTIDIYDEDFSIRTVRFENIKSRGDVAREALYRYDYEDKTPYYDRLASVEEVSDDEHKQIEKTRSMKKKAESNYTAIQAIMDSIEDGITQKTALIDAVRERCGLSRAKVAKALEDHTGSNPDDYQYWHLDIADKNAHVYALNWGTAIEKLKG